MKKSIINNLTYFFLYFIFITLINKLFSFSHILLYLGGLVGLFLPNLDHLLYVFIFRPFELTSQRIKLLINEKRYKEALILLYQTKEERVDLIFHSLNFQIIFTILTFWVISSSGSIFAKGLVLGSLLNLFNKKYFWLSLIILIVFGVMI